jgi:phosphocarrier protein FPr
VLSAELALELLPPEISANVRLCPAPIVEGAIAAAVQAGLGSDLITVCQEASLALIPKLEQIGQPTPSVPTGAEPSALSGAEPVSADEQGESVQLTIRNLHGLHARPAARFVKAAASFNADIRVRNLTTGKGPVSAKSLNAIATLGAVIDHQIIISARGPEAGIALQSLSKMVEEGFGEPGRMEIASAPLEAITAIPSEPIQRAGAVESGQPPPAGELAALQPGELRAIPVSEGVAVGPFYRYRPPLPQISYELTKDPQEEWERVQRAIDETGAAIRKRRKQLTASLGEEQAAIFDAHELILQDPDLLEQTQQLIFTGMLNGSAAWNQTITAVADSYRALEDPYLKQRAIDVMDVGNQVLFSLAGGADGDKPAENMYIDLPEPVILFAEELTPTQTAQLDMSKVLGLMTVGGGPTSHSAILARALGIPAISGVHEAPPLGAAGESLYDGALIGLDGFQGVAWVNPGVERLKALSQRREAWLDERQRLLRSSRELAATRDGKRIEVVANVGNVLDAQTAAKNGAEGIGLLRTEFLFLTRSTPPSEDEQYQALCDVGEALTQGGVQNWPMIVRTLDVGGDKELPYVQLAPEANPFLGVRALRLSLRKPDLFQPQLRAILRACASYRFRIMFPMVANLDEVQQARQSLVEAHEALLKEGIEHGWPVDFGIMVEIPSAAILSPVLAPAVDFFSIGTNDLTQYTLAAERGNPLLSGFADALHPAVLKLISEVAQASHQFGKWTGVCGELAGDPLAAPVLVGLGVDELSMNPGSIPRAKAILRLIDTVQAVELANRALAAQSAQEARRIAQEFYNEIVLPKLSA